MWLRFRVWCAVEVEAGRGGETELSGQVSLSLSLVGAGPGAVRWGGVGGGRRERWFENFRIKNKLGLEL